MFSKVVIAVAALAIATNAQRILCPLTNYPDPTYGPINDALTNLRNAPSDGNTIGAHACSLDSCSYGTGINVCNDGDADINLSNGQILDMVQAAFTQCGTSGDSGQTLPAFQNFVDAEGWNVLVSGGYGC